LDNQVSKVFQDYLVIQDHQEDKEILDLEEEMEKME